MAILRLRIPEQGLGAESTELLAWALHSTDGALLRSGRAPLSDLPRAERVDLVLPAGQVLLTSVTLPPVRGQKLRQLLPNAIEDKIGQDPEAVHAAAGARQADGSTPVAVVDKAWIKAVLEALARAGLKPRHAVPETCLPQLEPGSWTVVWDGAASFARTGNAAGLALDWTGDKEPPFALAQALRVAPEPAQHIVLRPAADATQIPDTDYWSAVLGVPVLRDREWSFAAASDAKAPVIDLLQGVFAPSAAWREVLPKLKPALMIGGALVALHVGATAADWWLLAREKNALQAEMKTDFQKLFPGAVVQDAPLQMKRKLAELRRGAGEGDAADFLPLLDQASALVLVNPEVRVKAISYSEAGLTVDLVLPNTAAVDMIQGRIPAAAVRARLDAVNPKPNGVEARLVLNANPS